MSGHYNGERFLPDESTGEIAIEHYQRYQLAINFVAGKKVLDAACGEGYGSNLLAETACQVIGLDIDIDTVERANEKYGTSKLSYVQGNIEKLPFDDEVFDVVISYETIEHVDGVAQNNFLKEICRVLKSNGILIMSTPNKAVYTDLVRGENKFHIKEFYVNDYLEFLNNFFCNIDIFCQYPKTGYFITQEGEENNIIYKGIRKEDSRYIIAICSNCDLKYEIDTARFTYFDSKMYYFLHAHTHRLESEIIEMKIDIDDFEKKQNGTIEEQKNYVVHLENDLKEIKRYNEILESDRGKQHKYIIQLENYLKEHKEYINKLENDIKDVKEYNGVLENDRGKQNEYVMQLESDLEKQKEYITRLEKDIKENNVFLRKKKK
ncbi:MAG TPA: methyltransferase domain-containing protein [Clostridiales bacterium]|nr:methyltransferase domain-containing protein [Clostridiales bacterium]